MTPGPAPLSDTPPDSHEACLSSCEKWQQLCAQGQALLCHNNTHDLSSKISQLFLGSASNKGCQLI